MIFEKNAILIFLHLVFFVNFKIYSVCLKQTSLSKINQVTFTKKNIGKKFSEPKLGLFYAMQQAQVSISFDHTNLIIRLQAFGKLIPKFSSY